MLAMEYIKSKEVLNNSNNNNSNGYKNNSNNNIVVIIEIRIEILQECISQNG